ncbi:CAAX amino terminal protease self- immunity [Symmachiella dynata]|uniref:CAAX amino terminal protease self-immunity n=1 Tax=Symmachiella dynata TaxID=2527995 RepID=A0A517ZX27_9PLAN|nr:type II CAAX endopeptidase family protein [Symmachiella dynata]QDU47049.1 CAAX amino terminal protease self- immunity [Symmachiella dynata]
MYPFDDLIPLLMTLAGFISAAVWATAVREFTQGRLPLQQCEPRPVRWDHWTILAALGIWVFVDTAVVSLLGLNSESSPLTRIQAGTYSGLGKCALLIPLWVIAAGAKPRDLLPLPGQWGGDFKAALWGLFASLLPVWIVSLLIEPLRTANNGHPLIRMLQDHPSVQTVAWITLAVLVAAPLCEELLFRVILQGWLQDRVSPSTAIVSVAIAFAAIHANSWPDPLPLIPLSLILGYIYYRRRSYLTNVLMHALFNGVNLLLALSQGPER